MHARGRAAVWSARGDRDPGGPRARGAAHPRSSDRVPHAGARARARGVRPRLRRSRRGAARSDLRSACTASASIAKRSRPPASRSRRCACPPAANEGGRALRTVAGARRDGSRRPCAAPAPHRAALPADRTARTPPDRRRRRGTRSPRAGCGPPPAAVDRAAGLASARIALDGRRTTITPTCSSTGVSPPRSRRSRSNAIACSRGTRGCWSDSRSLRDALEGRALARLPRRALLRRDARRRLALRVDRAAGGRVSARSSSSHCATSRASTSTACSYRGRELPEVPGRLHAVARVMTWSTLAIEASVALSFLVPGAWSRRLRRSAAARLLRRHLCAGAGGRIRLDPALDGSGTARSGAARDARRLPRRVRVDPLCDALAVATDPGGSLRVVSSAHAERSDRVPIHEVA